MQGSRFVYERFAGYQPRQDGENELDLLAAQQALAAEIQGQAFEDLPDHPLGLYYNPTAYRGDLSGIVNGGPFSGNVRRT